MKARTGPCVYGRDTATGGCNCDHFHTRGKRGMCACGHERAWHIGATMPTTPSANAKPIESRSWKELICVALDLAGDRFFSIEARLNALSSAVDALTARINLGLDGAAAVEAKHVERERKQTADNGEFRKGELAVLAAVAQARDPGATRAFITAVSGYKATSINTYLTKLRARSFITGDATPTVTDEGRRALGSFKLPMGRALYEHWMSKLKTGEKRLLEVFATAYPHPVTREQIKNATGYEATSINTYVSRLRARHLIVDAGRGARRAADVLFDQNGRG